MLIFRNMADMIWIQIVLLSVIYIVHGSFPVIQEKFECFEQTYSTCLYPGYMTDTETQICEQLTNPVKCTNFLCQSFGYIEGDCMASGECNEKLPPKPVTLNNSITVQLTCDFNDEYVHIENVSYVLPIQRINYCRDGVNPDCTNWWESQVTKCKKSYCACFDPLENEICEEQVSLESLHKFRETCGNSLNNDCTFEVGRKELLSCNNDLKYDCNDFQGIPLPAYTNCYAIWVKVSYYCYEKGNTAGSPDRIMSTEKTTITTQKTASSTPPSTIYQTTKNNTSGESKQNENAEQSMNDENVGLDVGIIAGASAAVVVILLLVVVVILLLFFVYRRKHQDVPKHLNAEVTFVNNAYSDGLSVSPHNTTIHQTLPTNGGFPISQNDATTNSDHLDNESMPEYAVINKSKKTQRQPDFNEENERNNQPSDPNNEQPPCDFIENTYYESDLATRRNRNSASGKKPDDMIENTYYEGSYVCSNVTGQEEAAENYMVKDNEDQLNKDEMIDNVYYETS